MKSVMVVYTYKLSGTLIYYVIFTTTYKFINGLLRLFFIIIIFRSEDITIIIDTCQ